MNVFALSKDPAKAARWHMTRHLIKMPLEYAQLLSTASHLVGKPQGYRPTHKGHPSTKWVCSSVENWRWLRELALELGAHYQQVYGRRHKSTIIVDGLKVPPLPRVPVSPVDLAMYDWVKYRVKEPSTWPAAVSAYRTYYRSCKLHIAEWPAERYVPSWWDNQKYYIAPDRQSDQQKLIADMHRHHGDYGVKWLKKEWRRLR
jgi:hypothetical protein